MKASIIIATVIFGLSKAQIQEHFYLNDSMTWNNAQNYCRTYYTDLSTVSSQEEQDMLIQLAGQNSLNKWIGGHRNMSNFQLFMWSDGSSFTYSKWEGGQPNNLNGNQHCISFTVNWFDYECDNLYTFFCYKIPFSLVKQKMTWEEALLYCRTRYKDLASLTSDRHLQQAKKMTVASQIESVWTGLHYLHGEWFWVNNETLQNQTSLPECPAQPYRCGARNTNTDKWENKDCAEKLNFLCN